MLDHKEDSRRVRAWSDAHLRAFMSLGVNMSLVTAGLGLSEKVARCISCKARMA